MSFSILATLERASYSFTHLIRSFIRFSCVVLLYTSSKEGSGFGAAMFSVSNYRVSLAASVKL